MPPASPLDKTGHRVYSARVNPKNVPSLTLPTNDFEQMKDMSNARLICVLRSAVLAPERVERFSPQPPEAHDAYTVRHRAGCIDVVLHAEGKAVFCCKFVPAERY